jgi:hypothetical protein
MSNKEIHISADIDSNILMIAHQHNCYGTWTTFRMNLAKAKYTWYVGVNNCSAEEMAESLW